MKSAILSFYFFILFSAKSFAQVGDGTEKAVFDDSIIRLLRSQGNETRLDARKIAAEIVRLEREILTPEKVKETEAEIKVKQAALEHELALRYFEDEKFNDKDGVALREGKKLGIIDPKVNDQNFNRWMQSRSYGESLMRAKGVAAEGEAGINRDLDPEIDALKGSAEKISKSYRAKQELEHLYKLLDFAKRQSRHDQREREAFEAHLDRKFGRENSKKSMSKLLKIAQPSKQPFIDEPDPVEEAKLNEEVQAEIALSRGADLDRPEDRYRKKDPEPVGERKLPEAVRKKLEEAQANSPKTDEQILIENILKSFDLALTHETGHMGDEFLKRTDEKKKKLVAELKPRDLADLATQFSSPAEDCRPSPMNLRMLEDIRREFNSDSIYKKMSD